MASINTIVSEIVARCEFMDIPISEPLAAFVARTVVEKDSSTFCMDKQMNDQDINDLIVKSITFLKKQDSPALETIKLQLDFDISYVQHEDQVAKTNSMKEKQLQHLRRAIASLQPTGTADLETLTKIYKQIFQLLKIDAGSEKVEDRNVEREIAAAMESVFPRVGLKAFVSLTMEEKLDQLKELSNIVMGIRLFNREIGKGGAGMTIRVIDVQDLLQDVLSTLSQVIEEEGEICNQYTEVLIYVHHFQPRDLSETEIQRWQEEMTNRRQFMSCLQSLQEDVIVSSQQIETLAATYDQQLKDLKNTVGSRTSVPKELVYPMFEALAKTWHQLEIEHQMLQARVASKEGLLAFRHSYTPTLTPSSQWISQARNSNAPAAEHLFETDAKQQDTASFTEDADISRRRNSAMEKREAVPSRRQESKDEEQDNNAPVRLSIESTPEFMQLPLEYQGYCPWTIVTRGGLLLPGDPGLGVVRYQNTYNVFVNERALQEFMNAPQRFADGIVSLAMNNPQLIHLLRLQDSFPETALSNLVKSGKFNAREHSLLSPTAAKKVDASTGTPVHFVEKNIDFKYEWNEWALRRQALKLANLRKCKTISTQTGLSNFRKEIETQVYLPGHSSTQTATSRGTNPPRTIAYMAGLRGTHKKGSSKYAEEDEEGKARPAMVTYTYET